MYEKLTKCPNCTCFFARKIYFPNFFAGGDNKCHNIIHSSNTDRLNPNNPIHYILSAFLHYLMNFVSIQKLTGTLVLIFVTACQAILFLLITFESQIGHFAQQRTIKLDSL